MKYLQKSETLPLKKLYELQKKIGYFRILVFGLKLVISGTLAYNFFLVLFSEKKSRSRMKNETQFSGKKQRILRIFESFVRYKLNSETCSMIQSICICFVTSKGFPWEALYKPIIYWRFETDVYKRFIKRCENCLYFAIGETSIYQIYILNSKLNNWVYAMTLYIIVPFKIMRNFGIYILLW